MGTTKSSFVEPIFVGDYWDDEIENDVPTLGAIEGGAGLLYRGTDHAFVGEAGGGKTFLLMHLIHDQVRSDRGALAIFLDRLRVKLQALSHALSPDWTIQRRSDEDWLHTSRPAPS